jgi:hypothetical protein
MKKFTKILESKYNDINDLLLYLEDITSKIIIENIDYKLLNKETVNFSIFFKSYTQLSHNNIDEFEKIIEYHKSILDVMKRLEEGYNIDSYFNNNDDIEELPVLVLEFNLAENLKKFFSELEETRFNKYQDTFNFKSFKFKVSVRINKKDFSAYLILMLDSLENILDTFNKKYFNELEQELKKYGFKFIDQSQLKSDEQHIRVLIGEDRFVFKIDSII